MAVSYKSIVAGFIATLLLTIAIIGNFAVMSFAHITINVATALIASLTVGIGIDYTTHFINAFKREMRRAATICAEHLRVRERRY